jgi:hypothetical protein
MADSEKTATQSQHPSVSEHKGVVETVMPATVGANDVVDPVIDEKKAVAENTSERNSQVGAPDEEEDFVYPTGFKLAAITIALCLSVFCMALVRHTSGGCASHANIHRTTPSSQQPFLA